MRDIIEKALDLEPLTLGDGMRLYNELPLEEIMLLGSELRQQHRPGSDVGYMIDRNVNITNICFSGCSFCNFCRKTDSDEGYITTIEEYREKIGALISLGGNQLLLQGGMHPWLGLRFYTELFRELKREFPTIKLHALGPPEIVWISKKEKVGTEEVLKALIDSGLDSLPGAGAEILSDRVRRELSPAKATTEEWLDVMRVAHRLNLPTSATMMFGHIETIEERIRHLILLRDLQNEKSAGHYGFITFIPWPCIDTGTHLAKKRGFSNKTGNREYIRVIAISRIILNNIPNIQSSILTMGPDTAMSTLHSGANDIGSVMIEENVVSSAGGGYRFDRQGLKDIITGAGFNPVRRDQIYRVIPD